MDGLGERQRLYLDDVPPIISPGQTVTFWARDPNGQSEILLDGKKTIYAVPGLDCNHAIQVTVTPRPKTTGNNCTLKKLQMYDIRESAGGFNYGLLLEPSHS